MDNEIRQENEKAILIGLNANCFGPLENSDESTLDELEELLNTAGGECVAKRIQSRETPEPGTFVGEGLLLEIRDLAESLEASVLVFDNELSPSQVKNIEEITKVRVLDRSQLILDIFAQRAQTKEGRLQVELAQLQYLLPRLTGMWSHLVRQTASGGKSPIGTRGPGETQLETDRRHIRRKISKLQEDLEEVRRVRSVQRRSREKAEVPVVALIGYTNAGKSTLLNYITGAGISAQNRLFDTLDPTTRTVKLEDGTIFLLTDTVGFIRKLPHHLVEAFKATLEELQYADVLLHVIDASSQDWMEHVQVVEGLIEELHADATPRIDVYNKIDLTPSIFVPHDRNSVSISASKGLGIDTLLQKITDIVNQGIQFVQVVLPYDQTKMLDTIYHEGQVQTVDYAADGIHVNLKAKEKLIGKLREYIVSGSGELHE